LELETIIQHNETLSKSQENENLELRDELAAVQRARDEREIELRKLTEESESLISSQKVRISSLEAELLSLRSSAEGLSTSKPELESTIASLESDLTKATGQRDSLLDAFERAKSDWVGQKQAHDSELHKLATESEQSLSSVNRELSEVRSLLEEQQRQTDAIRSENSEYLDTIFSLQTELRAANAALKARDEEVHSLATELSELKSSAPPREDDLDKEAEIAKLKSLLERAGKQDQMKQKLIDELQARVPTRVDAGDTETVEQLRLRGAKLEQQLRNSEPSTEVEKKNRQLTKMLEKSNRLYADLLEENQQLKDELEHRGEVSARKFVLAAQPEFFVGEQVEQPRRHPARKEPREGRDRIHVMNAYLKRSMLQFFLQDEPKREAMIPMILELVGCNEHQIATAQRQWARSHQFFSRGLFGLGK
jgi:chromosome segregation ATPase